MAKIFIGSRAIMILSEEYRKIQQKFFFNFFFFFFLKQNFLKNISRIHYVEMVNMIFFHLKSHFLILLTFENKCIRIGNFVVFLSESMELTSDRFFLFTS